MRPSRSSITRRRILSTISLVVGGHDDGRAGAVDPVDQLHDPDRGLGVEVAGGLVGQQQRRVVHERARDRDALLLAAGQLGRVVVELGGEADQAQDVRHLAADLLARLADHLERVGDVVVDGPVRQQLVVLEDDADVAAQVRHARARHLARAAGRRSRPRPGSARAPSSAAGCRWTCRSRSGRRGRRTRRGRSASRRDSTADRAAVVDLRHVLELDDRDVQGPLAGRRARALSCADCHRRLITSGRGPRLRDRCRGFLQLRRAENASACRARPRASATETSSSSSGLHQLAAGHDRERARRRRRPWGSA